MYTDFMSIKATIFVYLSQDGLNVDTIGYIGDYKRIYFVYQAY